MGKVYELPRKRTKTKPPLVQVAQWLYDIGYPGDVTFDPRPPACVEHELIHIIASAEAVSEEVAADYLESEAGHGTEARD